MELALAEQSCSPMILSYLAHRSDGSALREVKGGVRRLVGRVAAQQGAGSMIVFGNADIDEPPARHIPAKKPVRFKQSRKQLFFQRQFIAGTPTDPVHRRLLNEVDPTIDRVGPSRSLS